METEVGELSNLSSIADPCPPVPVEMVTLGFLEGDLAKADVLGDPE